MIAANVVTVFTQALIIIAFTRLAYGVSWGDNLPLVLLIVFVMAVLSAGLGAMAVMAAREESRAHSFLNVIIVVFTFIAGGYIKDFGCRERWPICDTCRPITWPRRRCLTPFTMALPDRPC